ncbi:hypothetical protein HK105_200520 [Polyrhizophydium stewartii]|uniref:Myb-like, SWIRM and MPN domain-containing protein 1 n=1 Tax=Polyrhizophydium stewartii TaxID=2732419 RepID=A0ABR4NJC9_9FUNG|nr:Myb-like, SWIRM and MPN domains 1 [Polyrhizophydium stewartii]
MDDVDGDIDVDGDEQPTTPAAARTSAERRSGAAHPAGGADGLGAVAVGDGDAGLSWAELEEYPEPEWLSADQQQAALAASDDMDPQSKALIESMLAEEAHYFGHTSHVGDPLDLMIPKEPAPSHHGARSDRKPAMSGAGLAGAAGSAAGIASNGSTLKPKWTRKDKEALIAGIKKYGYGAWKKIAAFVGTKNEKQAAFHAKYMQLQGVQIPGAPPLEVAKSRLAKLSAPSAAAAPNPGSVSGGVQPAPSRPPPDLHGGVVHKSSKAAADEDDDEDVEIDITDASDEDGDVARSAGPPVSFDADDLDAEEDGSDNGAKVEQDSDDDAGARSDLDGQEDADSQVEDSQDVMDASESGSQPAGADPADEIEPRELAVKHEHDAGVAAGALARERTDQGQASGIQVKAEAAAEANGKHAVEDGGNAEPTGEQDTDAEDASTPMHNGQHDHDHYYDGHGRAGPSRGSDGDDGENSDHDSQGGAHGGQSVHGGDDEMMDEYAIDMATIKPFEMEFCPEWFLGPAAATGKRINKTPERYKKIRDIILQLWAEMRPTYVSKSRIRPALKGEGDVNALSRVHTFLETIGAINTGPTRKGVRMAWADDLAVLAAGPKPRSRSGDSGARAGSGGSQPEVYAVYEGTRQAADDGSGRRRRKVRAENGEWVWELEGSTIEHVDPAEEERLRLIQRNAKYFTDEELEKHNLKRRRTVERAETDALGKYDPFKLIPLRKYEDGDARALHVNVLSNALIVMDFHSHLAHTEIIGLLGGTYEAATRTIAIMEVFPCNSLSTGVQCEMDPVSEMQAREHFSGRGLDVVGWYHSHPTFEPNPSIRDIENQVNYQTLFRRDDGSEPFVCVIVSPYDTRTPVLVSRFQFITVSEEWNSRGEYRVPYACVKAIVPSAGLGAEVFVQLSELVRTYRTHPSVVDLGRPFRARFAATTRAGKLLSSLEAHAVLGAPPAQSRAFLDRVRDLLARGLARE